MDSFMQRHEGEAVAQLSGFDRIVFRGTVRTLAYVKGLMSWLWNVQVKLKDFADDAERTTERIKAASLERAAAAGLKHRYLCAAGISEEEVARKIAAESGVKEGLAAVLTCVEPCMTYDIHRNRERKKLELVSRQRQCLHIYHYFQHRELGWMHARLQTWFPFTVTVCTRMATPPLHPPRRSRSLARTRTM